jgi:hypothetical protein
VGHYLDKGPDASAGNGGIGREENGRGNDDGGNMPHEHIARAGGVAAVIDEAARTALAKWQQAACLNQLTVEAASLSRTLLSKESTVSQQADSAIRRDIDGGSVRSMDQYWEGSDLRTWHQF